MGFVNGPGTVVTDGLIVAVDPASLLSYPGSGTAITNLVNSSLSGTLVNGPIFTSAGGGSYITTDGTNDHIRFDENAAYRFLGTSAFSLDLWVYPLAVGTFTRLINRESNPGGLRDGYTTWFDNSTGTHFIGFERYGSNSPSGTSVSIPNPTGKWNHCVFSYDGTTTRIYLNNILVSSGGSSVSITNTTESLAVGGAITYGSYSNYRLGSFKVYNIGLSAQQVTQNFNSLRGRYGL